MVDLSQPLRVLRPDDLLVLDLTFVNLRVSDDGARAERIDPASPARLIVGFPPQHVAESAFFEFEASLQDAGPPPVAALAAGTTRLAFELGDGQQSIAFADLLDWSKTVPRLAPNALPPGAAAPAPQAPPAIPPDDVTAIEFPYRLILSPERSAVWSHRADPFTVAGRTEIWHTRLTSDGPVYVRGIGRRDVADHFRTSLTNGNVADLATLTGDFTIGPNPQGQAFVPEPLEADLLLLSALGASARLRGRWEFPAGAAPQPPRPGFVAPTLEQYEHLAGLGRDAYVRVVERGWVATGHRASLVKVTERRFEPRQLRIEETPAGPAGVFTATAYLRQWFQVVIEEPEKDYSALSAGYDFGGLEMPLRTIRLLTLVTPKLDLDLAAIEAAAKQQYAQGHDGEQPDDAELGTLVQAGIEQQTLKQPFWIRAGDADVSFAAVATDWESERHTFSLPLVFVPEAAVEQPQAVIDRFAEGDPARRERPFGNQSVTLADPTAAVPRSTRAPVESLTFALQALPPERLAALRPGYRPSWLPFVTSASAHLEPLERLLGSREAAAISFDRAYLLNGLRPEGNPAGVFAALAHSAPVGLSTDRGGGLARPNMSVSHVSSRQGAMSEAFAKPAISMVEIADLFKDAKILGSISLASVLAAIGPLDAGAFAFADLADDQLQAILDDPATKIDVPVLRSKPVLKDGVPYATQTRYVWKPHLQPVTPLAFDDGSSLVLDARLLTPLNGSPATTEVHGELRQFALELAGVVRVDMDRLAFAALPGRKPDVTAQGFDVQFEGPLSFVNSLENVLPSDGFADPPAIAVTPEGISAGYTLGIPTVGVGIFSIQNLALSAALSIPFTEQPAGLRFSISERHHPFIVTVTLFGGGGFFGLGVSAHGLEEIEAAIEFGGNVALNLGVASGGVYIMAGIYFSMTASTVTLTGYLRCGGYLSVLGLISLSLEFYLAFTYEDKGGGHSDVWGQATLTVCVKVVFVSKSIDLTVERRFAGAGGDPTFDEVVDPDAWQQYCLAFAA